MDRPSRRRGNGFAISRDLTPRRVSLAGLKPLGRATRKHAPQQVRKLAASLKRFGFVLPIVTDASDRVVGGWGLVLAARQLRLSEVPAVSVSDLSDADLRMLRLALNRITEDAAWDREALALEFSDILELAPEVELELSGFEVGEIDTLLDRRGADEEDDLPQVEEDRLPVTQPGDLWILGEHRLLCADAQDMDSYVRLLGADKADMMFADLPYNVPSDGHVSGLGTVKHREFAMASGALSSPEFGPFVSRFLGHATNHSRNGAIHYVCMDWRHLREVLAAGDEVYSELKDLCIWNKTNAGVGSFYRAKHELVLVFKVGKAAHINNIALGRHGRHRTNVWDYVSRDALNDNGKNKFALHPTVRPVAMIADAIRDCSNRGGLILDPFGGAGTTLVAAERTGRRARVIETSPALVDLSVERWQRLTGGIAVRGASGEPFARSNTGMPAATGKGGRDAQA